MRIILYLFLISFTLVSADEINSQQIKHKTMVKCGNLIYAYSKTSVCFADRFLTRVATETNIDAAKKFTPVKLGDKSLFDFPFCVFSGEGSFFLSHKERINFKKYLKNGGFILASPGCSDKSWDRAFRKELAICFPQLKLKTIPMTHSIFSMVYKIPRLSLSKSKGTTVLEGIEIDGRLVLVYSKDGLNDIKHARGCCCCGGNEIRQSERVNVNIFTYVLLN